MTNQSSVGLKTRIMLGGACIVRPVLQLSLILLFLFHLTAVVVVDGQIFGKATFRRLDHLSEELVGAGGGIPRVFFDDKASFLGSTEQQENSFFAEQYHSEKLPPLRYHSGPRKPIVNEWTERLCQLNGLQPGCALDEELIKKAFSAINIPQSDCRDDMEFYISSIGKMVAAYVKLSNPTSCSPNSTCAKKETEIVDSFLWAFRQYDSFGKLPSGILDGHLKSWGSFQECLDISISRGKTSRKYETKNCYAAIPAKTLGAALLNNLHNFLPVGLADNTNKPSPTSACSTATQLGQVSFCLPASCSNDQAFTIVQLLSSDSYCSVKCQDRTKKLTTGTIVMLSILGSFVVVSLLSSIIDYMVYQKLSPEKQKDPGLALKMVIALSFYSNSLKILDTTQKPGQIHCLHGIRFLSMSWVILGHTYEIVLFNADNSGELGRIIDYILSLTITNATYSVDTFFLMSGLLVSYLWFKMMHRSNGKLMTSPYTWLLYYVHRYLRLTPLYVIIVAYAVFLTPYMTRGPAAVPADGDVALVFGYDVCKDNGWTNVLYINNIVHPSQPQQCYAVAWYLANDMQFYVFAPIVLVTLYYAWRVGYVGSIILIKLSIAASVATNWYFHLSAIGTIGYPGDPVAVERSKPYGGLADVKWDFRYVAPWIRFPAYLIGLLLGWYLQRRPKIRIHYAVNVVGWCFSISMALLLLYGVHSVSLGHLWPLWLRVFYASLCRPLWCVCVAWMIFACFHGSGGWVNEFLSWKGFIPLSRLTYCAYLLHIQLAVVIPWSSDKQQHWSGHFHHLATRYIPLLTLVMFASFFVSAMIEMPIGQVEELIFRRRANRDKATKESTS